MTSQVPHVWWLSSFAMPSPWSQGATCTWPSADGTSLVAAARRDDVAPRGEDGGAHERALAVGEITSEHLDRDFTAVHIAVGEAEVGVLKGRQGRRGASAERAVDHDAQEVLAVPTPCPLFGRLVPTPARSSTAIESPSCAS